MKSWSSSGWRFQKLISVGSSRWTATKAGANAYTSPKPATVARGPVSLMATASVSTVVPAEAVAIKRSEEHTSELQSRPHLVCRLLLEKKKNASIDESSTTLESHRSAVQKHFAFKET